MKKKSLLILFVVFIGVFGLRVVLEQGVGYLLVEVV